MGRWITYWERTNHGSTKIESPEAFTQMLTYFIESVFDHAEKYSDIPRELKEFLESSEYSQFLLGLFLIKSVRALETQKAILSIIDSENYAERPACSVCVYFKILRDIKSMLTDNYESKKSIIY